MGIEGSRASLDKTICKSPTFFTSLNSIFTVFPPFKLAIIQSSTSSFNIERIFFTMNISFTNTTVKNKKIEK
jgi:hypothetical protein